MKVFISHSSADRWIAQRIALDLKELRVETFLDEKDVETGQPIKETVHAHIWDCDEFLLLLSPTSLHSAWVLIELGGALILRKQVVPVLLHVSPQEIPVPIANQLARDINEIEVYYHELKRRTEQLQSSQPIRETRSPENEARPHGSVKLLMFVAWPRRFDAYVVAEIKSTLAEFVDRIDTVYCNDAEITERFLDEVAGCNFGLCYFSEPARESEDGDYHYQDDPNIVFLAGILQSLSEAPDSMVAGWLPVREESSSPVPFDLAAKRLLIVPRHSDRRLRREAFSHALKASLHSLLGSD